MTIRLIILTSILAIMAFVVLIILFIAMLLGAVNITDGCLFRYNNTFDNENKKIIVQQSHVMIPATGNNNISTINNNNINFSPYGKWTNSNISIKKNTKINVEVSGEISLCKAYLPKFNIQSDSNKDINNNPITIPRIGDKNILNLIFDANTKGWRNITELFYDDQIIVYLYKTQNTNQGLIIENLINKKIEIADCSNLKTEYSPICGKYNSLFGKEYIKCINDDINLPKEQRICNSNNNKYIEICTIKAFFGCIKKKKIYPNDCKKICTLRFIGFCIKEKTICNHISCASLSEELLSTCKIEKKYPSLPYSDDGLYTIPKGIDSIDVLAKYHKINDNLSCCYDSEKINKNNLKYWHIADNASGLFYQFSNSEITENVKGRNLKSSNFIKISDDQNPLFDNITQEYQSYNLPSSDNYYEDVLAQDTGATKKPPMPSKDQLEPEIAKLKKQQEKTTTNNHYQIILKKHNKEKDKSYLQYSLYNFEDTNYKATGGYVLGIQHTKCRHSNGIGRDDDKIKNRGAIEYIILENGLNPNTNNEKVNYQPVHLKVDNEGKAIIESNNNSGTIWFKIVNHQDDYKDSKGEYNISIESHKQEMDFYNLILEPFYKDFKEKIKSISINTFQNITCSNKQKSIACINYFKYIKILLILYIIIYGMMFLLGTVQITTYDLVIRIIKVGIVGGLINGTTFNWFSTYIFDFVTSFSEEIIANIGGYSFSSDNNISNPLMFMNEIMTRITNVTFFAQMLAVMSMGLLGVIYFMIVFVSIGILIFVLIKATAVFTISFIFIALLISLTPLFLTFLLFEPTRGLFDNWVRFSIRYMVEPIIVLAGVIILTHLFTVFLDSVISFSVCWKCALAFKIPFIGVIDLAFTDVPIFCFMWFGPWGYDVATEHFGINLQDIATLIMIAYALAGYIEVAGSIAGRLMGQSGGPSTSYMSNKLFAINFLNKTGNWSVKQIKSTGSDYSKMLIKSAKKISSKAFGQKRLNRNNENIEIKK